LKFRTNEAPTFTHVPVDRLNQGTTNERCNTLVHEATGIVDLIGFGRGAEAVSGGMLIVTSECECCPTARASAGR
jgi:hypothetical protein